MAIQLPRCLRVQLLLLRPSLVADAKPLLQPLDSHHSQAAGLGPAEIRQKDLAGETSRALEELILAKKFSAKIDEQ